MMTQTEQHYSCLEVHQDERVGIIRLNRPEALNALNDTLISELIQALQRFEASSTVGAILITGSEKAFAAGADITGMAQASETDMKTNDPIGSWDAISRIQLPLIVAIQGYALGGGLEIAMMADMIIASETAKLGQPEIKIGVIPGAGGTQRLTRAIGKTRAMELILTGRTFSGAEAYALGLVTKAVPHDAVYEEALTLAKTISDMPAMAVKAAKQAINQVDEAPLQEGIAFERQRFYSLFATKDQKEGMQAFLEKRTPVFTHQ